MKTIELLRHAKSSWKYPHLSDHQRPLKSRGRNDCSLMAAVMIDSGCRFINCHSSSATRAIETIDRVLAAAGHDNVVVTEHDDLYCFDTESLVRWLQRQSDDDESVLITGHNPGLTLLAHWLCREVDIPGHMPTCSYLRIECDVESWAELSSACGRMVDFQSPKMNRQSSA